MTPDRGGRFRRPVLVVVGVGIAAIAVVVAAFVIDRDDDVVTLEAVDPVAPVALPDGRIAWAERTTGVIRALAPDDFGDDVPAFAEVPDALRTDGQRGLLGLAGRAEDGAVVVYASWTRAEDGRLVVGRLAEGDGLDDGGKDGGPDDTGRVWVGPVTTALANGGTLAFRNDELLLGVGELQDPDAVPDPTTPNGKVLALDPSGPPDQVPEVVAGGWHNPFALTVVDGEVWLLDNAPGDQPERIVRIPADGVPVIGDLDGQRAPSAVAADGASLLVCGFLTGEVERFPLPDAGVPDIGVPDIAPSGSGTGWPCATGVAVVGDRVVTTSGDSVSVRSGR